jgi:DNA-binding CsgD family transcriptional regulator
MLRLFAASQTQSEVADALGVQERMIRYRLHRVFNYTGASNVTGAVAEAIRRGWIE